VNHLTIEEHELRIVSRKTQRKSVGCPE
jgi:hypothetical protein